MAQVKCSSCGYPYATFRKCPNCGTNSPRDVNLTSNEKKAGIKFLLIIVIGVVIFSILKALDFDFNEYDGHIIVGIIIIAFLYLKSLVSRGKL